MALAFDLALASRGFLEEGKALKEASKDGNPDHAGYTVIDANDVKGPLVF